MLRCRTSGENRIQFKCIACGGHHTIRLGDPWTWNNDFEQPTFNPSVLYVEIEPGGRERYRCHSWVKNGNIQYLDDSTHAYAGQTITLPEIQAL